MIHVVWGIDPSLTGTGIARIVEEVDYDDDLNETKTYRVETWTIPSKPANDKTITARTNRLSDIAGKVFGSTKHDPLIPLAVAYGLFAIEGPASIRGAGSMWDRAGLWWKLVGRITRAENPIGIVPPTVVKKWATGRGNADKSAVAVAMTKLLPNANPQNDNEADALALAHMAAVRAGFDVPRRSWQTDELLNKGEWPEPEEDQ